MSHVFKDKPKLVARIRRIRGQVEAIERALEGEGDCCLDVLQLVASVRGAVNGLMAELVEGHVGHHVVDAPDQKARQQGADELIQILRTYMK
ncbi:metal/formaldehyde-sensitive transcriptional repressor [Magnetospirillum sulfuroxidans]|uniref:Metal/formaldehyde-sensitive transcriptional repressor n=1 Tax=Magnetospirillum sulfuroxidans TaxID=611300 RepID=A0ABS5IBF5_9PROT|nr:metal/formaldehyde-sensitive transcriptional repressor [Magnetospirillum sulfuroxidans]MBR9971759.1 metal/formaldehyde-sensitive transcriptional repressor [Magnetospirillum sulfuroxidans]